MLSTRIYYYFFPAESYVTFWLMTGWQRKTSPKAAIHLKIISNSDTVIIPVNKLRATVVTSRCFCWLNYLYHQILLWFMHKPIFWGEGGLEFMETCCARGNSQLSVIIPHQNVTLPSTKENGPNDKCHWKVNKNLFVFSCAKYLHTWFALFFSTLFLLLKSHFQNRIKCKLEKNWLSYKRLVPRGQGTLA